MFFLDHATFLQPIWQSSELSVKLEEKLSAIYFHALPNQTRASQIDQKWIVLFSRMLTGVRRKFNVAFFEDIKTLILTVNTAWISHVRTTSTSVLASSNQCH